MVVFSLLCVGLDVLFTIGFAVFVSEYLNRKHGFGDEIRREMLLLIGGGGVLARLGLYFIAAALYTFALVYIFNTF